MSLFVAGAAFGDVGLSLFVPCATFGDAGPSVFDVGMQAQYLVMLECEFSWQAQHLVKLDRPFFVAGATFGEVGLSPFVMLDCHFLWQAQHW